MDHDRGPPRPGWVDPIEGGHPQLGEVVEPTDHAGCGDGGPDLYGQKTRGQQEIGELDPEGHEENPVEEDDSQTDMKRKKGVHEQG